MKRRAFFGLLGAAPAAIALPAAAPAVQPDPAEMNYVLNEIAQSPMPAGLSDEARMQHREHIARNALAHLRSEQVRYMARQGQ